ncbi:hypothetical protein MCAP1_002733 [Malassezia caprae]|uniref:Uncharacterized protein n=1 Tax=Malassezia caprae TaxID=1381934 RepID=A0AAF0E8Z7_9BASI|nr:hypothetical protein MCAP1_002733 [Malassezia caprae]
MESSVHCESGAIARSESLPSSLTATPDLDRSSFLSEDLGTPASACIATGRAPTKAHTLDLGLMQREALMSYLDTKEPMLFFDTMEGKAAPVSAGLPPSWLSPASLSPCDSPSTQDDHTPPPKRMRLGHSESHPPIPSRSSAARARAPRTEALRAWLLERRAQLHEAQAQVRQAQETLQAQQAHWTHVQSLVGARIAELRRHSAPAPAPAPAGLGLLGTDELDDPLWDGAPVSSVADLLEQNILCL